MIFASIIWLKIDIETRSCFKVFRTCDIFESVVVFIKLRFPGPFFPPHNERIDWKPREGEVGTLFGRCRVRDGVFLRYINLYLLKINYLGDIGQYGDTVWLLHDGHGGADWDERRLGVITLIHCQHRRSLLVNRIKRCIVELLGRVVQIDATDFFRKFARRWRQPALFGRELLDSSG